MSLLDLNTAEEKYEVEIVHKQINFKEMPVVKKIKRLSDGALLGQPSSLLKRFEEPQYTHYWYSKGDLGAD